MNSKDKSRENYQAYLIRFWREDSQQPWRAAVLKSGIEHIYHFAAFESLVAFLEQRLSDEPDQDREDCGGGKPRRYPVK